MKLYMSRLCNCNLVLLLLIICVCRNAMSQTHYYKLTKKIENGEQYSNTAGGQFITFDGETCFDSDKYGISVGNGRLRLDNQYSSSTKTYIGNSYFGNTVYRFKPDLSILNIIVNKNLIYVYKRETPPATQTTCTLIRQKKSSNTSSNQATYNPIYSGGYDNSYNSSNTANDNSNTSKQKNKVRKRCAYCSGKGERIQHESVSTFGLDGPRVHCNICNQSWSYGTVHSHHKCSHCNGTGYYEYEY